MSQASSRKPSSNVTTCVFSLFSLIVLTHAILANATFCFVFDNAGEVENEIFKFNERIEIRLKRELKKGRSRLNCTSKDNLGNWRWFGHQFYL